MRRFGLRTSMLLLTASVFLPYSASFAGETTIYIYDALGRLVEVRKSGTINNAVNTDIAYDAAGNRTDYNVSGSDGAGSDGGVTGGVAGDFGDGGRAVVDQVMAGLMRPKRRLSFL